jgi:hypothetical protein
MEIPLSVSGKVSLYTLAALICEAKYGQLLLPPHDKANPYTRVFSMKALKTIVPSREIALQIACDELWKSGTLTGEQRLYEEFETPLVKKIERYLKTLFAE